jgi:hypothetical protein
MGSSSGKGTSPAAAITQSMGKKEELETKLTQITNEMVSFIILLSSFRMSLKPIMRSRKGN